MSIGEFDELKFSKEVSTTEKVRSFLAMFILKALAVLLILLEILTGLKMQLTKGDYLLTLMLLPFLLESFDERFFGGADAATTGKACPVM